MPVDTSHTSSRSISIATSTSSSSSSSGHGATTTVSQSNTLDHTIQIGVVDSPTVIPDTLATGATVAIDAAGIGRDTLAVGTVAVEADSQSASADVSLLAAAVGAADDAVFASVTADVTLIGSFDIVMSSIATSSLTVTDGQTTGMVETIDVSLTGLDIWTTAAPATDPVTEVPVASGSENGEDATVVTIPEAPLLQPDAGGFPIVIEGNTAILDLTALGWGDGTIVEVDASVLTVADILSSVTAFTTVIAVP